MQKLTGDFFAESMALESLIKEQKQDVFETITQFKNWTIYDVIAHLHLWNMAALWTLEDSEKNTQRFVEFFKIVMAQITNGATHQDIQRHWAATEELKNGADLFSAWQKGFKSTAREFSKANSEHRVKWGGPDMSVASCIIARQMETWAHAQAVFDVLGKDRVDTDRLKNVAHIGVTTYSWSFNVRGLTPIKPKPYIRLVSPSGDIWEWNDPQNDNSVTGSATEFCQVVTQTRNIEDTRIACIGEAAKTWMSIAQCFAGGVEAPPIKGSRFKS